ncbi:N-acetyltransferase [Brevundimonas sp. 2R-24]|uniref:N-acetyltransferase n=1 Tax=Peiella sedimenti TaxID=3061083 RepID=A0ABT8SI70_9CAUL|nr:N-acetyltransferase [Caulobacteraceae bacterium XZ-24]
MRSLAQAATAALCVLPENPSDAHAVDALVEAAFGPGRYAKTAERLREGSEAVAGFCAHQDGRLVGTVRLWPILIGETHALFLGPIAVAGDLRSEGVGQALMLAALAWADEARSGGVLLVGDTPYFGRFGFERAEGVDMPGPVNPARLLWRGADQPKGRVASA